MRSRFAPRGFSLIEMMIASTIALFIIAGAVSAGIYLQRRGLLEERTMETQNAGRAARDLLSPAVQRAGAGFGSAPLYLGGAPENLRYAVSVSSDAGFSGDPTFALPTGTYAGMQSDVLEIFEADIARALRLDNCGASDVRMGGNNNGPLCLERPAPPDSDAGIPANTPLIVADPQVRAACVGVAQAGRNSGGNNNLSWTLGAPGAAAFAANSPCSGTAPIPPLFDDARPESDGLLMPLSARAFRVNWKSGQPVLEMDPDGSLGAQGYQPLSDEIERLQVRLGVEITPGAALVYYPDPTSIPVRPALDQCTNAACWPHLAAVDAGVMGVNDYGPGSARDELMRRVRVVELAITARSDRPDSQSVIDGGADDENNPMDGYKRRHFIIRVAPRNFGFAGG
ncbi:PilW family protein [Myxococcus sp. RHSTA-1-4]|uniref:PilW family protein n=1 Tax=Myxococcus sp. RHSTA-1-4 TaxID=2874601 RepID=UPI001CBB8210|nr:prepilin-type N-terminal cleavage/methylation domain-containing protein [Myxococcus sp. RHSTA-1-4]MBZ4415268.1 prepilin-type N-terminal cleavage/methylation domain-containing protein [Myxococcus sp. RHSTA-1-4]